MIKTKLLIICILSALIFNGCASTGNRVHGKGVASGKYKDRVIGTNEFEVSFAADHFVSAAKAKDLALLRCATISLANGYKYFSIFKQTLKREFFNRKLIVKSSITCFIEIPEPAISDVYDAKAVKDYIQNKYNIIDRAKPLDQPKTPSTSETAAPQKEQKKSP